MNSNLIGIAAWAILGLLGIFTFVDLGFGPILICPKCGGSWNSIFGIVLIVISVAAFLTNRRTSAPR